MKTIVINVVSLNAAVKGGVVRLTENSIGNFSLEGQFLSDLSTKLFSMLTMAIDSFLAGYKDPDGSDAPFYVEAI